MTERKESILQQIESDMEEDFYISHRCKEKETGCRFVVLVNLDVGTASRYNVIKET